MDKNLKAGLIVVGVIVGLLAVALVANAAGLTTNYAGTPYRQMMQGGNWQGGMMGGNYGGMMGGYRGGMMGGYGPMMDFDDMPCRYWTGTDGQQPYQSCPYFDQAQ